MKTEMQFSHIYNKYKYSRFCETEMLSLNGNRYYPFTERVKCVIVLS